MLDRIADCWGNGTSASAVAVAGITSEIARSKASADPDVANATVMASLRTDIGHLLTSRRDAGRRN